MLCLHCNEILSVMLWVDFSIENMGKLLFSVKVMFPGFLCFYISFNEYFGMLTNVFVCFPEIRLSAVDYL